jgi:hypothetical protein
MIEGEGYSGEPTSNRSNKKRSYFWRQSPECAALRCAIKAILMHPHGFRWTVQGFGFIRTYLPFGPNNPKRFRLNVWNNRLTVPNVSIVHDHPWAFTSWIISGEFRNQRIVEDFDYGVAHQYMPIKCGENGGPLGTSPSRISLRALPVEHYRAGDIYQQDAEEVHRSMFDDGTVTLNDRVGDTEQARVFWSLGAKWVDAQPREATHAEIEQTTKTALDLWQNEID